jgi:hypothetical protein
VTPYSLGELIEQSAQYFEQLKGEARLGHRKPWVCHHFFPLDGAPEDVYLPALPVRLKALSNDAAGMDVIGDPVGIELWFAKEPTPEWIDPLVKAYHEAAIACSAVYGGWSYEPDRREDPSTSDSIH